MRIHRKLVIAFLLLSLGPLVVLGVLYDVNAEAALIHEVLNHLDSVASIQKSRVESAVAQNLERLALVSSRTQLRLSLDNYTRDPKSAYQNKMNQILLDARSSITSFRELSVLTLDGKVVASTNVSTIGTNLSDKQVFLRGMKENTTDIFFFDKEQRLGVYISGPLHLNNTLLGVMVIVSDVDGFLSVVSNYTGLGSTGETNLSNRTADGNALFLMPTRLDPNAALNRTQSRYNVSSPTQQAFLGGEQLLTDAVDYRGEHVLAATRYINETNWGLVVKIDRAEAFAPVVQLRGVLVAIVLLSSGAIVLVSLYLARSITRPIAGLTQAATEISGGNLSRRVETASPDEIGTLARAFNQMTENLVETNTKLDLRVRERTADLEREVAARKQAAEELAQRSQELVRSNTELEQFAYVASHDLQEPLRMVASYTELLAKRYKGKLDSDADEFIAYAVDGANRMRSLINDLLAYSRVGTRGKPLEPTDCNAVLDEALANLQPTIREASASITRDTLPTVMADGAQLAQVFQNLVGNAIKFHGKEAPRVHVSAEARGNECVFSIRDNGIGIDPKFFDRLFVMFQRLHARNEYPGTGIGLAICKKIVERHGGRIWVESQPGAGSTFYFAIPAKVD